MEGLQRSRYGTMAEGKKPSKFSSSLGTRGKSLSSNTETEEKPNYFKLQNKKVVIVFFELPWWLSW